MQKDKLAVLAIFILVIGAMAGLQFLRGGEAKPAASNQTAVKTVPFGQWRLPIGYEPQPTGGTCRSGCHRAYRYDRNEPVQNLPDAVQPPAPADEPPTVASSEAGGSLGS